MKIIVTVAFPEPIHIYGKFSGYECKSGSTVWQAKLAGNVLIYKMTHERIYPR